MTPVGLYIFVHPVVFVVHDPYNHVGWFFALQQGPNQKMPNTHPNPPSNSQRGSGLNHLCAPYMRCQHQVGLSGVECRY